MFFVFLCILYEEIQMYRKCKIVLDDSDYIITEFSVKDEKSK